MAGLAGRYPSASYGELLTVGTSGAQNIDTTARAIVDGDANAARLSLASDHVPLGTGTVSHQYASLVQPGGEATTNVKVQFSRLMVCGSIADNATGSLYYNSDNTKVVTLTDGKGYLIKLDLLARNSSNGEIYTYQRAYRCFADGIGSTISVGSAETYASGTTGAVPTVEFSGTVANQIDITAAVTGASGSNVYVVAVLEVIEV